MNAPLRAGHSPGGDMRTSNASRGFAARGAVAVASLLAVVGFWVAMSPGAASAQTLSGKSFGELDCNGDSPAQQAIKLTMPCADIRGSYNVNNANVEDG